jgi:hypothetical protein
MCDDRSTIIWHNFRHARQLARLPTNELWHAAMLGMLGGAVATVTLIEAFSRSYL